VEVDVTGQDGDGLALPFSPPPPFGHRGR
jgi:hypothetical protein